MRRKTVKWVVAIMCVLALAGGSILWYARPSDEPAPDKVIARVNDTQITMSQVQARVQQRQMAPSMQQEQHLSEQQMQQQVLEDIIAEILLYEEAKRQGIKVDDASVSQQLDAVAAQFDSDEEMKEVFAEQGFSEEELKQQLRMQLKMQELIDEYVAEEMDEEQLEVSDEEVTQLYEEYDEEIDDFPDFEEAEPYLREEIRYEREQKVINRLIAELREDADIIFVE